VQFLVQSSSPFLIHACCHLHQVADAIQSSAVDAILFAMLLLTSSSFRSRQSSPCCCWSLQASVVDAVLFIKLQQQTSYPGFCCGPQVSASILLAKLPPQVSSSIRFPWSVCHPSKLSCWIPDLENKTWFDIRHLSTYVVTWSSSSRTF